jgi:hypothetical protein
MKSVYTLSITVSESMPVVFYVGCTTDAKRRETEHRANAKNPKHKEYKTYKYQLIRELNSAGLEFALDIVAENCVTDDADEYSWVLKMADYNRLHNIHFYDHQPLTNMKAGDFLEEMLAQRIRTPAEIRKFTRDRELKKINSRVKSYIRQGSFTVQQGKTTLETLAELEQHRASVQGMLAAAREDLDLKASRAKRRALKDNKKGDGQ